MRKQPGLSVMTQFLLSNVVLVLVFVAGSISIHSHYAGLLRQEVSVQTMQDLKKSADLFESQLDELRGCAYTIAQDSAVSAVSRSSTLSIADYAHLSKLHRQLPTYYQSSAFVDSVMVYFQNTASCWTSTGFLDPVMVETSSRGWQLGGMSLNGFFTREELFAAASRLEYVPVQRRGETQEQLVCTFDLLPLSNFKTKARAAILIDMDQARQILSFPQAREEGSFFRMVGEDGRQVYSTAQADQALLSEDGAIPVGESIQAQDELLLFSYMPEDGHLAYQLFLPIAYINGLVWSGQRTSLLIMTGAFLLTALLAWVLARRNAAPVSQLARLAYIDSTDRNEFRALHDSLSRMLQDRSKMEASLQHYLDLQKNVVFSKLLGYGFHSEEEAVAALAGVEVMPESDCYGTAYLHFTSPEALDNSAAHLVLTTIFRQTVPGLMHVFPMSSRGYALVYELGTENDQALVLRQLESALAELKQQYHMIVTLVAGPVADTLLKVPESYQSARYAYYMAGMTDYGRVLQAQSQAPIAVWQLPEAHRHRLISLIQSGEYSAVEEVVRQFFDEGLRQCVPSKLELAQLAYDLRGLLLQLQQQTAGVSTEAMAVNALPHCEDCDQLMQETLAILRDVCAQVNAYKQDSVHRMYVRILQYLQENYTDPNLSLASIADVFNLSDKYLSKFFKKEGHINLAAYIEELRLKKAVELMRDSNAALAEIGAKCGYASLNSFYKAFRRVYGASPSAYRQRLKENGNKPS